jgi:diguanylate cyclase (GGDEF)-like protein/PAS domain S-box-containing protein
MLSQQEFVEDEEDRFARFTRIAAAALGAPIAQVSLVDADRQRFRPRAFCSHAIALGDLLLVPDAHLDERFAGDPLVAGAPFVRSYAGQPLYGVDGRPRGTLCIMDQRPRQFSDLDRRMLRDLAQMVQDELNRDALAAARGAGLADELAKARARAIESEERLATIADNVPALVAYIDTSLRYRFANTRYQEWFGVRGASMLGKTVPEAMGEAFFAPRRAALERCLAGHASALEFEEERRGRRRVISTTYLPHLRDGAVHGIYVLSTDATSAREYERQLLALAHADHLTGLPNRRSYEERLLQAIARARRSAMPMALAYLDVDHFKQVNDSLGHAGGDAVLREFGKRLSATVRSTDTVARLAGDEFVVVLEQVGSARECGRIADKLLEALRADFTIDGKAHQVKASIGIAWSAHPEQAALAHAAGEALCQSKRAGRDTASVLVASASPA